MEKTSVFFTDDAVQMTTMYPTIIADTAFPSNNSWASNPTGNTTFDHSVWTKSLDKIPETPTTVGTFYGTSYVDIPTETLDTEVQEFSLDTGQIAIAVTSGFFSFITVLGNLIILYAFCAERRLRTYTNYYIVGLSVADLVAGIFTMPLYTVYWVLGYWPFSPVLCDIYVYINHVFVHVSLLAILILAVDRYQAVYHPLKHLRKRTLRHACFMISFSYVIPFIVWMPYTILWPYIAGARRIPPEFCYPQYVVDSVYFSILAQFIFFWIPLPIMSTLYWRIYVVIKQKSTRKNGPVMMQDLSSNSTQAKDEEKTLKVVPGRPNRQVDIATKSSTAPGVDYENPGFESNEDNNADCSKDKNGTDSRQNQPTASPNASYLHSQQSQLPILRSVQGNGNEASLRRNPTRMTRTSSKPAGGESRKESSRATRTLKLIFIVLLVSTIPWAILVIVYSLCPTCIPLVLYQASVYIAHMNSTVNPFCYAVANPLYMNAFLKLLCCGRRTVRRGSHNSTKR